MINITHMIEINQQQATSIINTRLPLGKFYIKGNIRDKEVYTGIDNDDGEAWTEDFRTKEECINWLIGDYDGGEEI